MPLRSRRAGGSSAVVQRQQQQQQPQRRVAHPAATTNGRERNEEAHAFDRALKDIDENCREYTSRTLEQLSLACEDLEEDAPDGPHFEKLDPLVKEVLMCAKQTEILRDVLVLVRDNHGDEENLDKIFEAELKRRLDRQTFDDAFYAKRDEYIDFRTSLWNVHHPDEALPPLPGAIGEDDDLVMTNEKATYKCPLTLTWFVDPVKNKLCGHVYSRAAVMPLLAERQASCPVGGCGGPIRETDLEEDPNMAERTQRAKRRAEDTARATDMYEDV